MVKSIKNVPILFFAIKDKKNINKDIESNMYNINNNINIQIWDNKSFEKYIKKKDIFSYKCFMKLNRKFGAMIGDCIRYSLLYYEGGVYMDAKSGIKNTNMQSLILIKNTDYMYGSGPRSHLMNI